MWKRYYEAVPESGPSEAENSPLDFNGRRLELRAGDTLWRSSGRQGDVLCKPLLPELYEPVLTHIGNGLLVLRGFERDGEAATVQEWRCELLARA